MDSIRYRIVGPFDSQRSERFKVIGSRIIFAMVFVMILEILHTFLSVIIIFVVIIVLLTHLFGPFGRVIVRCVFR